MTPFKAMIQRRRSPNKVNINDFKRKNGFLEFSNTKRKGQIGGQEGPIIRRYSDENRNSCFLGAGTFKRRAYLGIPLCYSLRADNWARKTAEQPTKRPVPSLNI